ncbi:hypothetical protein L9F63_024673, partial [Diploptera punctata]
KEGRNRQRRQMTTKAPVTRSTCTDKEGENRQRRQIACGLADPGSTHTPNGSDRTGLELPGSSHSQHVHRQGRKEIDKDN